MKSCRDTKANNSLFDDDFTKDELSYALQQQDMTRSPGPDGIQGHFLNHLGILGKGRILHLFNLSWSTGKLPVQWKSATIIPIRKPNKKASSVDGYRPISLTCIICKLIERMILRRLTHHLLSNNLIPPEQYAFRKGHCTMDQILFFSQNVRDAQNCKPTKHTLAVFLDLTKAFDRVWKYRLLYKCYKDFNIRGRALPWISNFLNHRNFCVNYQNKQSGFFKLYQGIPQGSVLSPTLFSMFIAGIEKTVSPCQISIFADDIVLWASGSDIGELESTLNDSLEAVGVFSNSHKLNFNPNKSVSSFFTTNRHLYNYSPAVFLFDQLLECDRHPSYLGFTLDPEINCRKHLERIADKARKRLRILKFISGRDWGADASTLRLTYCSLVRPILEYGYQVFQTASASILKILDRVQLSAARIITGLRNSCPNEVVLYEADIVPLTTRFRIGSLKYFNKLRSLGGYNRTAEFILNWKSNQRLKRDTPLEFVKREGLIDFEVVPSSTLNCLSPTASFGNICFNDELCSHANKQLDHPDLLKQLALEVVNSIPSGALVIYTDGSKLEDGKSGSGIFINSSESEVKVSVRNPDNCSVFRSEIIAIGEALTYAQTTDKNSVWILTDSRSAIQYFKNWPKIFDIPDQKILSLLYEISLRTPICLQWIPSHVGVYGNETADVLARNGCDISMDCLGNLTANEIHSLGKHRLLSVWHCTPSHPWYAGNRPGLSITCCGPRPLQSAMARFRSGHLKCLRFRNGTRTFQPCSCSLPASPDHLLSCLGVTYKQLLVDRDFLQIYEELARRCLLDLV